jgi:hypothetical protein
MLSSYPGALFISAVAITTVWNNNDLYVFRLVKAVLRLALPVLRLRIVLASLTFQFKSFPCGWLPPMCRQIPSYREYPRSAQ